MHPVSFVDRVDVGKNLYSRGHSTQTDGPIDTQVFLVLVNPIVHHEDIIDRGLVWMFPNTAVGHTDDDALSIWKKIG